MKDPGIRPELGISKDCEKLPSRGRWDFETLFGQFIPIARGQNTALRQVAVDYDTDGNPVFFSAAKSYRHGSSGAQSVFRKHNSFRSLRGWIVINERNGRYTSGLRKFQCTPAAPRRSVDGSEKQVLPESPSNFVTARPVKFATGMVFFSG